MMPAIKDKTIVIPLEDEDIQKTVKSLPRLPSESGIIDIQWKRRIGQKNCHLQAKVDPSKIFKALEFLKHSGNPHYQTFQSKENFKTRCMAEDPDGFRLLFGQNEKKNGSTHTIFFPDDATELIMDLPYYLYLIEELKNQREFEEKDVVGKHQQIDYNETGCMVEKYPEAMHKDKVTFDNIVTEGENTL